MEYLSLDMLNGCMFLYQVVIKYRQVSLPTRTSVDRRRGWGLQGDWVMARKGLTISDQNRRYQHGIEAQTYLQ